ncbi:MAG: ATP synthase F1 subunit gamma [Deltaproteobacteria bacterium]
MPGYRDIKNKISSIKKTQQITKAMNMVAAAKLRGAQVRMESFRPYAEKFASVMGDLSRTANPSAFPLMAVRPVRNILILLVTSDRGLCGSFNTNLIATAEKYAKAQTEQGRSVKFACIGRKGANYFRKSRYEILTQSVGIMGTVQMFNARQVGQEIIRYFVDGVVDEVQLLYGRFINVITQRPTLKKLLPISSEGLEETSEHAQKPVYTYEPDPEQILNQLMPMYVNVQIMHGMLETAASEQAARMTAMDKASRACKDMIVSLTMTYNKARQAAITKELMDIVGGAEALKG